YCFTHMSIGTSAPALLHSNFGGQRGGGFFALVVTSTGAPGVTFCVPDSNEAQGSTQKPVPNGFPFMSAWWMQRCDRCLQSPFLWQLFPSPAVLGSRGGVFFAGRAWVAPRSRSAARSPCIRSASA